MSTKKSAELAPHLEAALRRAWVGYPNKLQPETVDMVRKFVTQRHSEGVRCFVRSQALYRLPGVPDPQPWEHPSRPKTRCVGHRDTFIDVDGQVVSVDTITDPTDPSYKKAGTA